MPMDLTVNGVRHSVDVAPETPLLWVIRDQLRLTGTKFSCGIAQCGACTVHINGVAMRSCSIPVSAAAGKTVTTIEGLSPDGTHPVQLAWMELDVPQCGYCQSGMIMSVVALLKRHPNPTDAGDRRRGHQRVPLQHVSPHPSGDQSGRRESFGGRRDTLMSANDRKNANLTRRGALIGGAAAAGALVIGFWIPRRAQTQSAAPEGAAWADEEPETPEVNAWVVVEPDDTVTVRIAQTELGQGVWTSNAMMVAEELQCDWSKVRPQYASANRDAREMAPAWTLNVMGNGATDPNGGGEPIFGNRDRTGLTGIPDSLYRRMRTNAAASVKDGRYYLQLAGAEARERLLLAAAKVWNVPVEEVSSANSVITHRPTGRTTTYGKVAALAAETPHPNPERIRIKPPSEWTLMGTEQKNLDVPSKVTGKAVYGIDVQLPGTKWAAVKSCPVYGGKVKSYDFEAIRREPGVISAIQFPIPDPTLIRGRIFGGGVAVLADSWYQAKTAIDKMPIEWDIPPEYASRDTANIRADLLASPERARQRPRQCRRRRQRVQRRRQDRRSDVLGALSPARPDGARKRDRARHRQPRRHLARRPEPAGDAPLGGHDHRHSGDRTSISTCAISAVATAATATARKPSRRSTSPT